MKDAMGASWAALVVKEDPQGRGTLLDEAGAEGGGERGGERGGGGERECTTTIIVRGSVGNSARRGEWDESDQPTRPRSVRGSCAPYSIKALAPPPRAPWKEAPVGPPKRGQYDNVESKGRVQGSAGEERHGICGMPGGFA